MASNAPAPGFIGVVSTANKIPVLQQLSEFRKSQQNCIFSKRNFLLIFRDPPYLMNACSLDWSHPGVTGIRTWCAQDSAYESRYVQSWLLQNFVYRLHVSVVLVVTRSRDYHRVCLSFLLKGYFRIAHCLRLKTNLRAKPLM